MLRVSVLVGGWGSLAQDDDAYGRLAIYWAETGTFGFPLDSDDAGAGSDRQDGGAVAMRPTAYRPPLYPWLLSWLVDGGRLNLVAVAVVHLWLGLASVGLTFGIASRLGVRWPMLPALAVACDPLLLRGSQLVMTETLITFFALAIWGLWLRLATPRRPGLSAFALLGLVLGLSVLTRPTMLPWAVCLVALTFWVPRFFYRGEPRERGEKRLGLAPAFVVGLVLALTLLPWIVRNARMLGTPIWATTHGGYTLLLANNPLLYAHFGASGPSRDWDADNFHRHWAMRRHGDPTELAFWQIPLSDEPIETPIDELADDRLANRAAKATIAREPAMFALSCLYRIGWLWALAPHEASRPVQLGIGAWYAAWFACALWGVVRIGRAWSTPVWLAPAAFVLTLTLLHAVYWSNMRMRAPLMPIVYVVAAVPLSGFLATTLKKTSRGEESP
ncbi:MAG: hypothetical protein ACTHK7_16060 [Aureliella sp.]